MRKAFGADTGGNRRATGQHGRQAGLVIESEQAVLAGRAHVGIDQQGALAQLRKQHRQVGCDIAATITTLGAGNRQCRTLHTGTKPAHHQLTTQGTQGFNLFAERIIGRDNLFADAAFTTAQVRIGKLAGQGKIDIGSCQQTQRDAGFAKTLPVFMLLAQDEFSITGSEAPLLMSMLPIWLAVVSGRVSR